MGASREGLPWREKRAGAGWTVVSSAALVAMTVVLVAGTWWTVLAIRSGNTAATLLRFCLAALGGAYYLVLHRTARIRSLR